MRSNWTNLYPILINFKLIILTAFLLLFSRQPFYLGFRLHIDNILSVFVTLKSHFNPFSPLFALFQQQMVLSVIFTLISSLFSGFFTRPELSFHDLGQFLVEIEGLLGPEIAGYAVIQQRCNSAKMYIGNCKWASM